MSETKTKIVLIISVLSILAVLFLLIFFLYDSPAYYVKTPDGSVYVNEDGAPIIYYKDMFGRDFYDEDGKRVYAAVPNSIEPVTDPADLSELQEAMTQD